MRIHGQSAPRAIWNSWRAAPSRRGAIPILTPTPTRIERFHVPPPCVLLGSLVEAVAYRVVRPSDQRTGTRIDAARHRESFIVKQRLAGSPRAYEKRQRRTA